jgi:hypothetical protein
MTTPSQDAPLLLLGPRHRLIAIREDPGVEQLTVPHHLRLHPVGHKRHLKEASFSPWVRVQSVVGEGSKGKGIKLVFAKVTDCFWVPRARSAAFSSLVGSALIK